MPGFQRQKKIVQRSTEDGTKSSFTIQQNLTEFTNFLLQELKSCTCCFLGGGGFILFFLFIFLFIYLFIIIIIFFFLRMSHTKHGFIGWAGREKW